MVSQCYFQQKDFLSLSQVKYRCGNEFQIKKELKRTESASMLKSKNIIGKILILSGIIVGKTETF